MTLKKFPASVIPFLLTPLLALAEDSSQSGGSGTSELPTLPITDVSSLQPITSADLSFPSDRLMIHTNGAKMAYEVSKTEFFVKDKLTKASNVEALATEFGSAEEMRQFVHTEDNVWGQQCMLVLYPVGEEQTGENRQMLTHKIEIVLHPETASMALLQQLAGAVGVEILSDKIGDSGSAALRATCGGSAVKAAEILSSHPSVKLARPMMTIPLVKCNIPPGPNDPLYRPSNQYYIHHLYGGVDNIYVWPVWCGGDGFFVLAQRYFGRSVEINLLDDGIQGEHPEIDRSYLYRKDEDFVDGDNDGGPSTFQDNHGTEMAGIIIARQNNGVGIAGIAPSAQIYSSRAFGTTTDTDALANAHESEASTVGVISLGFVPGGNYADISNLLEDAFKNMAERKDVPIAYPAGGADNGARMDYDRAVSHRYTICTAAFDAPSEPGANITTTAPGFELTTTDRTGDDGDQLESDYMFDFTGTSPASAQTTGVLALMQDARPELGWRDYQEILMLTSSPFDGTFADRRSSLNGFPEDATTITPFGPLPWVHSYLWGPGMTNATFAVALAELWAPLPDSASLYKEVNVREQINEEIGVEVELQPDGDYTVSNTARTFLFDFNRIVPSKKNLRIEHAEVRLEWEEPPNGGSADLLPAYVFLCSPYYTNGPSNPSVDDIDNRPLSASPATDRLSYGALLSEEFTSIGAPVEWTYTTNRFWSLVNTGGSARIGVPDQDLRPGDINESEVIEPGVWELDVAIQASILTAADGKLLPFAQGSMLSRRLIEAEITFYGTENNVPPTVTSNTISSSGNPDTPNPRTAFADEDLIIDNVSFFDPEGDPLQVNYVWQILGEDGLTWEDLPVANGFQPGLCDFDEVMDIGTKGSAGGNLYGRYFLLYQPDGTAVAYYFADFGTLIPPAEAVANSDRQVPINGVEADEGVAGVAEDIALAITNDPENFGADGFTPIFTAGVIEDSVVRVRYEPGVGDVINGDAGTSNMLVSRGVADHGAGGNCFGNSGSVLEASDTVAGNKYRALIIPRDGLREGFRTISDEIIVNSRPVSVAAHTVPYLYDVDMWIQTVPPEDLPPFAFINEVSQGTGGPTTNEEWVEIIVNFTTDLRGFKLSNDIATFDLTFTQDLIWEEVPFGTIIVIYNGEQRDPLIPPDTPIEEFSDTKRWFISSTNRTLFIEPSNGDGWGEFSNIDCTPEEKTCDGAHVGFLSPFATRDTVSGVSFNGNTLYVDAGVAASGEAIIFDGPLEPVDPDDLDQGLFFNTLEPNYWGVIDADGATPGTTNSANNQTILDFIDEEMKTSVPTYRFYPGDSSQAQIDPVTGETITMQRFDADGEPVLDENGLPIFDPVPDEVPSDLVPGLRIDRKTGIISGRPDVPDGGVFTIKIQRFHSFSSEIQIFELDVSEAPRLVDTDDEDDDGLINLLEEALGGDYYAAETNILPTGQIVTEGGMSYPSITFRRLFGGDFDVTTGRYVVGNLLYTVEGSPDLQVWSTAPEFVVEEVSLVEDPDNFDIDIVTLRVMDAVGSTLLGDRYFLRLRVERLP